MQAGQVLLQPSGIIFLYEAGFVHVETGTQTVDTRLEYCIFIFFGKLDDGSVTQCNLIHERHYWS